jgi:hypothetical protein
MNSTLSSARATLQCVDRASSMPIPGEQRKYGRSKVGTRAAAVLGTVGRSWTLAASVSDPRPPVRNRWPGNPGEPARSGCRPRSAKARARFGLLIHRLMAPSRLWIQRLKAPGSFTRRPPKPSGTCAICATGAIHESGTERIKQRPLARIARPDAEADAGCMRSPAAVGQSLLVPTAACLWLADPETADRCA